LKATLIIAVIALLLGLFLLATNLQPIYYSITGPGEPIQEALKKVDWPNVIVGAVLSMAGGALINLAMSHRKYGRA